MLSVWMHQQLVAVMRLARRSDPAGYFGVNLMNFDGLLFYEQAFDRRYQIMDLFVFEDLKDGSGCLYDSKLLIPGPLRRYTSVVVKLTIVFVITMGIFSLEVCQCSVQVDMVFRFCPKKSRTVS